MRKVIARLLPLLFLFSFHLNSVKAQQAAHSPSLALGDAVVTGFSGTVAPDSTKPRPPNRSAIDLTFINPDGPSARIIGLGQPGFVWDGRVFPAPKPFDVLAKDVGQVFGAALDDRAAPNVYLAATSAFGLQLVGRGRDGQPERRKVGGPAAGWMKGQFGLDLQGDPGSIYKVDGTTGVVTLFAKVMLNGVPNPGPALGNLAYDAAHNQLFVSDLYTGMIHRFATADGSEGGPPYDHGVTGRGAAHLSPVPFDPGNRPNIASSKFDSENPNTWGFAPPERRVWGLAVHDGRLFYSARNGAAADGPQIWSVGIQQDGSLAADARLEVDVPAQPGPYPVSDIAFAQDGAMILAQRAPIAASYDYSAFTKPGQPRVLRYSPAEPSDPNAPKNGWVAVPGEYAVGFPDDYRNSNGGVDLGYGYGPDGRIDTESCESAIWITGENLRNDPALRDRLAPGGPLVVHGIQGSDSHAVRDANAPPWASYFVAYDDKFNDPRAHGHLGVVRIDRVACGGGPVVISGGPAGPSAGAGGGGGGGGGGACVCQKPLVPGPTPGRCMCPQGTVLEGNECVPETCPPPLVQGPTPGVCLCKRVGGACECAPPLVAGPTPGECIWPQVTPSQSKECVKVGSLIIKKEVTTHDTLIPWPAGPLFPMILTCNPPPFSASFNLAANGTYTANNIPFGSTCTVAEGPMPAFPSNLCPRGTVPAWVPPPFTTPASVVINGTTVTMIVHNSVTCEKRETGQLSVTKTVKPDPRGIASTLSFPMTVTCTNPTGSYPLTVHGNTSSVPINVPIGSVCTVTEVQPPLPAGCTWLPPVSASVTIHAGLNQTMVTNAYRCTECPPPQVMNAAGVCTCPPPMVPGPVAGTCTCPDGMQLVDGKCVRPIVCKPPMVQGAAPGVCVCPEGTVREGNECVRRTVRPIECGRPLIPNAAGTACVCPDDMVRKGRECVHPAVKCPRGMVKVDGRCERRERNKPPEHEQRGRNPNGPTGFPGRGGQQSGGGGGGAGRR